MEQEDTGTYNSFWPERGQPWRTEPEISAARQAELAARRRVVPDVARGVYPFKGMRLDRADVEWLLATHEDRGPVDPDDERQRDRVGPDLRGADLSKAQLSNLPLTRMGCDARFPGEQSLTEEQRRLAAIDLHEADLTDTHLEGACLDYANMERAALRGTRLEGASLWAVNLREADCDGAHFEGADLWNARLQGAFLYRCYLYRARLHEARLAGVHFNNVHLADENGVGPMVSDVHWEGANLSVVNWASIRMLGEEWEAWERKRAGIVNDQAVRLRGLKSAARANQQLALALQTQGLTDEAGRFFYRSRVLWRKVLAVRRGRYAGPYLFSLLLDWLTGYGYRMGRMVVAYVLLVALFATLYYGFGRADAPHVSGTDAFVLSITAFHGRVFASPFHPGTPQSIVTAVEAITGFLFEGIFIAMLTQRFFGR